MFIKHFNTLLNSKSIKKIYTSKDAHYGAAIVIEMIADDNPTVVGVPGGLKVARSVFEELTQAIHEDRDVDLVDMVVNSPMLVQMVRSRKRV